MSASANDFIQKFQYVLKSIGKVKKCKETWLMMKRKNSYKCIVIDFQDHDINDQGLKIVHKYMKLLQKKVDKVCIKVNKLNMKQKI